MSFAGSLSELNLSDLIQLVGMGGKTGVFHISNGTRRGDLYLLNGQIVHAQVGEVAGEPAVYALAMWRKGQFEFETGTKATQRTVEKGNSELLVEAARLRDEWRMVSKKVPSSEAVPEFIPRPAREGQINLNTAEWRVLSKVDGRRSVRAISAAAGLAPLDVAKILYGLVSADLISVRNDRAAGGVRPAPRTTLAARAAMTRPAPASRALQRLARVRDVCNRTLGSPGAGIVKRHCDRARAEIESGGGPGVLWDAVDQIVRAASKIEGCPPSETLLEQLSSLE